MDPVEVGMVRRCARGLAAALVIAALGCGGGGGGNGPTPPVTTTTTLAPAPSPAPTPTPSPGGGPVTINLRVNPDNGDAPLNVAANMCGSTDPTLQYTYDWGDGSRTGPRPDCRVEHSYGSDGVSTYQMQGCVIDAGGQQACAPHTVTAFASATVTATYACPNTVTAADLTLHPALRAMNAIDKVVFTARGSTGNQTRNGTQSGATWSVRNWQPNIGTIQSLSATTFSGSVSGATADGPRPGC
jgi:hypothetical protein